MELGGNVLEKFRLWRIVNFDAQKAAARGTAIVLKELLQGTRWLTCSNGR